MWFASGVVRGLVRCQWVVCYRGSGLRRCGGEWLSRVVRDLSRGRESSSGGVEGKEDRRLEVDIYADANAKVRRTSGGGSLEGDPREVK